MPKLKANRILRMLTTKVLNKEVVSKLGHLFEYEEDKTYESTNQFFKRLKEMRNKVK